MTEQEHPIDEHTRKLLMGALDDELRDDERAELERRLADDPALRKEWERLQQVKAVTGSLTLRSPPDETWERYWQSVYYRMERGVGWIFFSLGLIVVVAWSGSRVLADVLRDPEIPLLVRGSVVTAVVGGAVLIVSVAREKWFAFRADPYKDVQR